MTKDYYQTLGVKEDASDQDIKRAYRKLAKRYHPDRNKGDAASEAKFKEVSEANEVLSDKQKRAEYDTMRKYGAFAGGHGAPHMGGFGSSPFGGGGFPGGKFTFRTGPDGGFEGYGDLDDLLSSFFGGGPTGAGFGRAGGAATGRQGRPRKGADLVTKLQVSFLEAVHGTRRLLSVHGSKKKLSVKIPAGIANGGKIRLSGQGEPGIYGGRNGNLIITVEVMPHQEFERKGNDIFSTVEISFIEAIRGCKKEVKTLAKTVSLNIPPGTQPGAQLRLKGMGLAVSGGQGDQYVDIKVTIPTTLTDKQRQLLEEWGE